MDKTIETMLKKGYHWCKECHMWEKECQIGDWKSPAGNMSYDEFRGRK